MQEWKIGECITRAKNNDSETANFIIQKMDPLIKKYVKKLYFMEKDDAYQELVIALLEGIVRIDDCTSDPGCLSYLEKSVKHKYYFLCKKNIRKEEIETSMCDESLSLFGTDDQTAEIINNHLLETLLYDLTDQEHTIMKIVIEQDISDAEIARQLGFSRQYIYKVKKRVYKKWKLILNQN